MPAQLFPRRAVAALAAALLALTLLVSAAPGASWASGGRGDGSAMVDVLVLLHEDQPASRGFAQRLAGREAEIRHVYRHALQGFSARLPAAAAQVLARHEAVALVEPDGKVAIAGQEVPTGVRRVFAPDNPTIPIGNSAEGRVHADIAIIDTGIDVTHPDLNVVHHVDCTESGCPDGGQDDNGHGTHVAGSAAALNNDTGVVGVAPGARLWAVKALDEKGEGSVADVVAAVEWVTANAGIIDVVNLSLTAPAPRPSLTTAINSAVAAGLVVVAAAGNKAQDAADLVPANHPDVITVSALADYDGLPGGHFTPGPPPPGCLAGDDDHLANFSNFGDVIDIAAPGVCILSTWPGGGLRRRNGTSMAAPHVAGAAALLTSVGAPTTRTEALAIRSTLIGAGNDTWEDGTPEPILDVSDTELFNPMLTTAPFVAMTNPAPGAPLSGTVTLAASTAQGEGSGSVEKVDFLVDNTVIDSDTTAPFSLRWNTSSVPEGTRVLHARAHTTYGVTSDSSPVSVIVDNTPPKVQLANVTEGTLVRGSIPITGSAADSLSGLAEVRLEAAGEVLTSKTSSPVSTSWDTTTVPEGDHVVSAIGVDRAGNLKAQAATVTVDNTPPSVTLTAPTSGATIRGNVLVTASASDANGVDTLTFLANGAPIGTVSGPTAQLTWDTTTLPDGPVALTVQATDAAGNSATSSVTSVEVRNEPVSERLAGADRFATAARVSSATFPEGAPRVFVATGLEFPDALAAGSIAAAGDVPLLLTAQATLPAATDEELARLRPGEIILVGGTKAVSAEVAASLSRHAPVRRVQGRDRFETAALLATEAHAGPVPVAFVASGLRFPDALAGGPTAALLGGPLLLVTDEAVPAATIEALRRLQPARIVVLGGRGVVGDQVLSALRELTPGAVERLSGADRFATAVAVSQASYPHGSDTAFIATGITYADALAGAPAAARARGPILLVAQDTLPELVASELGRLTPSRLVFLGGTSAVSDEVLRAAVAAASP